MGHRWITTALWASLTFTGSMAIAPTMVPPAVAQVSPTQTSETINEDALDIATAQAAAQGLIALGLLGGAIALSIGIYQYNRNKRWDHVEFLRRSVKEFESDPDIWKALKILDFEEYRDYEIIAGGKKITFRATNDLLYAALASHGERIAQTQHFEAMKAAGTLDDKTLERYQITTALRDWFNKMLNGLEHFGYFVESGLFTPEEIRPWMIYWIRLIADRTYRRPGSSKVYDYLYSYIHEYGFYGVIKLFEKFGFRILPTPYRDDDFADISKGLKDFDVRTALSLAKASQLIYQDLSYVAEIAQRWGIDVKNSFRYINSSVRDTQAFLFKTDDYIVVAFRGSQEIKDWQTNFSTRLKKFALTTQMEALEEDITPPRGQVHRGFQSAWDSVERSIVRQIQQWNEGRTVQFPLLLTGHSLGGALATVAAASLVKRKFPIQGLYTFGQPRVGDWIFASEINMALKGRVFRFVNNNDIVPHIPPPYLPWNPFRLYVHLGATRYFNARGSLVRYPSPVLRLLDFFIGLLRDSFEPGFDLIKDHYMEYYISNLEKSLEIEKEKEKLMKEQLL